MLNVALLAAGIGLLSTRRFPTSVAIVLFVAGAVSALLSVLASDVQHAYYKNTRDLKKTLEERLPLGGLALAPTPGMGAVRERVARVTTLQKIILVTLLLGDLAGLGTAIAQAVGSKAAPRVQVVVQVKGRRAARPSEIPVVFSQSRKIAASQSTDSARRAFVRVRPGDYEVSVLASQLCVQSVRVLPDPLQSVVIRCE